MRHMVWALLGALAFILAYTYYTVAGLFSWPGGNGGMVLIEFGTTMSLVVLAAALIGACLSVPPAPASRPEDAKPEQPKGSP